MTNNVTCGTVSELSADEITEVSGGMRWYGAAALGAGAGYLEGAEVAAAVRGGLFGAEMGAWAGPIGIAAGAVAGAGVAYAAYHYL